MWYRERKREIEGGLRGGEREGYRRETKREIVGDRKRESVRRGNK